jgi:hypothetical protein
MAIWEQNMHLHLITAIVISIGAASSYADEPTTTIFNRRDFVTMKLQISKDFEQNRRYREITADNQEIIKKTLARMDERWQKADEFTQLSQADRLEMVNNEQLVDTILRRAAIDSRTVCQREEPIGSHFPKNSCKTVAQQKREQERAQESICDGKSGTN